MIAKNNELDMDNNDIVDYSFYAYYSNDKKYYVLWKRKKSVEAQN